MGSNEIESEPLTYDISQYRYFRIPGIRAAGLTFLCALDYAQQKMAFAVARCTPNDNFSHAIGRRLVEAQFASGKVHVCDYYPQLSLIENAVLGLYTDLVTHPMAQDAHIKRQIVTTALYISLLKNMGEISHIRRKWGILSNLYIFWRFRVRKARMAGLNGLPDEIYGLVLT